jgi:class 3 adenylate cyclase/pimeloyl-ACP methyl ester carboxylesterase
VSEQSVTRYAKSGDVHIAYQVVGDGPIDVLLLVADFIPTDAWEEQPRLAHACRRLASFSRLIRCDRRGVGLSDPITPGSPPTLEQWIQDALAVLDAVGSEQAVVIGANDAGAVAALLAATHPQRVRALVFVNSYARATQTPDYPWGWPESLAAKMVEDTIEPADDIGWGLEGVAPSMADDDEFRRWWDRAGNRGASPATARALLEVYLRSDVRDILDVIDVPTLVVHRVDDRGITIGNGRYLAQHIPGAKLVELPGDDDIFWLGDADTVIDEIEEFVTGARRRPGMDRVLATVLFTDIVGSTARASSLGDNRWARLLDDHDRLCTLHVERCRGRMVKSTGDGLLATFDGPARAIACALDLRAALRPLGIEIRAGLHTGEIELRAEDIGGIAVHIAARIEALAGEGEVLASRTVVDLVVGSGIEFRDRGEHELKGVPGRWLLFAVADT